MGHIQSTGCSLETTALATCLIALRTFQQTCVGKTALGTTEWQELKSVNTLAAFFSPSSYSGLYYAWGYWQLRYRGQPAVQDKYWDEKSHLAVKLKKKVHDCPLCAII